ncbi:uncharacterized protein LOC120640589 [Panicum virgatum]|nr:uncharacterized protein LOC120640589 [Panicum virgatum]XP_039772398.1 uncharacterized protein LOC120640589 [Panicum virgatum]
MRIDGDASSSRGPATTPQEPGLAVPLPEEQAAEPDPEANVAGASRLPEERFMFIFVQAMPMVSKVTWRYSLNQMQLCFNWLTALSKKLASIDEKMACDPTYLQKTGWDRGR